MADPKLVARANEVIDRLFALNEAMESADAFCAYLEVIRLLRSRLPFGRLEGLQSWQHLFKGVDQCLFLTENAVPRCLGPVLV